MSEVPGRKPYSAGAVGQRVSSDPMAKLAYNSNPSYVQVCQWLRLLSVMKCTW